MGKNKCQATVEPGGETSPGGTQPGPGGDEVPAECEICPEERCPANKRCMGIGLTNPRPIYALEQMIYFSGSPTKWYYWFAPEGLAATDFTVSLWFKTDVQNTSLFGGRKWHDEGYHDRDVFLVGGNIYSYIWSVEIIHSENQNFADNEWHFLVFTHGTKASDGTMINGQYIYVDGIKVAQGTKSTSDGGSNENCLMFGRSLANAISYSVSFSAVAREYRGYLSTMRIYNGICVSPAQVQLMKTEERIE